MLRGVVKVRLLSNLDCFDLATHGIVCGVCPGIPFGAVLIPDGNLDNKLDIGKLCTKLPVFGPNHGSPVLAYPLSSDLGYDRLRQLLMICGIIPTTGEFGR